MFSVHGVTGQVYRGTLEGLGTVAALTALRRARGIDHDGEESGPEALRQRRDGGVESDDAARYEDAARAYRAAVTPGDTREPVRHAYQVMTRTLLTLPVSLDLATAWRRLNEHGYGQAPVVDGDGRLVGLVTRDALMRALDLVDGDVRDPLARTIGDVMLTPAVSADPVTSVRRIARVMLEYDLAGLPVVNEQQELVGIVTRGDILRAVANEPPLNLWA